MLILKLILSSLFALPTLAQIMDNKNQKENNSLSQLNSSSGDSDTNFKDLLLAMEKLSKTVSVLNEKFDKLEDKIQLHFEIFSDSIEDEKQSLENIASRLDSLDFLSLKVENLELKIEDEATVIRNVLSVTSDDIKRMSERFEKFEKSSSVVVQNRKPETHVKENAKKEVLDPMLVKGVKSNNTTTVLTQESENKEMASTTEEEKQIGEVILQKVENVLPRLLASELNHFYLNMATKTDYSLSQLENLLVSKLRRIEMLSKNSLLEIKDSRQDISHVTHLQRTVIDKFPRQLLRQNSTWEIDFSPALRQLEEKLFTKIDSLKGECNTSSSHRNYPKGFEKLNDLNSHDNSELWNGFFNRVSSRTSLANIQQPASASRTDLAPKALCLDTAASNTLQEVKQLLRTLMTKGEDLRRTLTKQAKEGIEHLKDLQKRFSVLLRRINTDPRHVEALLAEVEELENLVENSYSSILVAQNLYLESCRQHEGLKLSTEEQIIDVLDKLVTNIDLGHQFNKKQLEEVRQLIEKINKEEEAQNITLLSILNPLNVSASPFEMNKFLKLENMGLFNKFKSSVLEVNITEDKIRVVLKRIGELEEKLQAIDLGSGKSKNIIDELLTSTKDLKNYSKDQIFLLENFRKNILMAVNIFKTTKSFFRTYEHSFLSSSKNRHKHAEDNEANVLTPSCYSSLLSILNSSTVISQQDNTLFPIKDIINIIQDILRNYSRNRGSNNSLDHYLNLDDILMDDYYNWQNNNYYYDEDDIEAYLSGGYEMGKNDYNDTDKRDSGTISRNIDKKQFTNTEKELENSIKDSFNSEYGILYGIYNQPQKYTTESTPKSYLRTKHRLKPMANLIKPKKTIQNRSKNKATFLENDFN